MTKEALITIFFIFAIVYLIINMVIFLGRLIHKNTDDKFDQLRRLSDAQKLKMTIPVYIVISAYKDTETTVKFKQTLYVHYSENAAEADLQSLNNSRNLGGLDTTFYTILKGYVYTEGINFNK